MKQFYGIAKGQIQFSLIDQGFLHLHAKFFMIWSWALEHQAYLRGAKLGKKLIIIMLFKWELIEKTWCQS